MQNLQTQLVQVTHYKLVQSREAFVTAREMRDNAGFAPRRGRRQLRLPFLLKAKLPRIR